MRYLVLATDYDGTIARLGHVDNSVWAAVRRLKESGRRAILVTGRELEDLQAICAHLDLFDRVVAENGAVIYHPATREVRTLSEPPPPEFVARLKALNVTPLSAGHVIVATVKPHQSAVLKAINELGLELQVIFNQDAVMVLPSGVNKATGLIAALRDMGYSPHNTVAVGDAENDHALLTTVECGAAVGHAVPALKERADLVTRPGEGTAVVELIDRLLADDLATAGPRLSRHDIVLGTTAEGKDERVPPFGKNVLIAGTSGSGKSVIAAGLLERLADARYQYAVIDPEGDYPALAGAVVLGSPRQPPLEEEVLALLESGRNAHVKLIGIPVADRAGFFDLLFARLLELRSRNGRPHWIVVDDAHHLMPAAWPVDRIPQRLQGVVLVTVHPGSMSPAILRTVDLALAVGQEPARTLSAFFEAGRIAAPPVAAVELAPGEALAYWVGGRREPFRLAPITPRTERHRHRRKYAEGRLPDDRTFVFRGPDGKLSLRAYNLMMFLDLAVGVDDATWQYHLKRKEYSRWFREAITDEQLAREVEAIEEGFVKDSTGGRTAVRKAIEQRYSLPTTGAA